MSVEKRNHIQKYFWSKIYGTYIWLDMGDEGEAINETDLKVLTLRNKFHGDVNED